MLDLKTEIQPERAKGIVPEMIDIVGNRLTPVILILEQIGERDPSLAEQQKLSKLYEAFMGEMSTLAEKLKQNPENIPWNFNMEFFRDIMVDARLTIPWSLKDVSKLLEEIKSLLGPDFKSR